MGDNTARTRTNGSGTATNGNGLTDKPPSSPAITRERLIVELGKMGGVLFDLVSERVDQRLEATSQDRTKALEAATSTFSRQVADVSKRAASLERKLPAIQGSVDEAKTAARESTSAAQAAERAASGAAENASAAALAQVNELKTLLSGEVPELMQNEKGELIVTTVHKEPEDYVDALQGLVTQAVSLLTQVDARLRNLEGLSLLTEFEGRLRSLEAMLTGKKPEKAAAESDETVLMCKTTGLEQKLLDVAKKLGLDIEGSLDEANQESLQERVDGLENGLKAVFDELGSELELTGTGIQERLNDIEEALNYANGEAGKRGAAGKTGDE